MRWDSSLGMGIRGSWRCLGPMETGEGICGVVCTCDIVGVDLESVCCNDIMYTSEYEVCRLIPAPSIPPAFDNSLVISPDLVLVSRGGFPCNDLYK